jgi:hypothetical protein
LPYCVEHSAGSIIIYVVKDSREHGHVEHLSRVSCKVYEMLASKAYVRRALVTLLCQVNSTLINVYTSIVDSTFALQGIRQKANRATDLQDVPGASCEIAKQFPLIVQAADQVLKQRPKARKTLLA